MTLTPLIHTNDLVTAARASIKDEALQATFDLKLLPQTYTELKALYGKELSGEALYKKIQQEASKFIDDALALIKQLGCFVAGTLVHTQEGLKPIEDIKVGDYVLSKPENGEGELCYQPVTRTYEYENRELYYVAFSARKELLEREKPAWDHGCIAVTGGHPIWVERMEFLVFSSFTEEISEVDRWKTAIRETEEVSRWMSVEGLYIKMRNSQYSQYNESIDRSLDHVYAKLEDGRAAVISICSILQSDDPDIGVAFHDCPGWEEEQEHFGRTLCFGREGVRDHFIDPLVSMDTRLWPIDTEAYNYSDYETESDMSVVRRSGGYLPMRRKVYNFEVANTHTYFVTRWGLWVHNTSGASLPLNPAQNLGVFPNEKGFTEALKQSGGRGIGVVPDINEAGAGGSAQAHFEGSIVGKPGLQGEEGKLYAFALGYVNPIKNGDPYTKLGDAIAYLNGGTNKGVSVIYVFEERIT
jgi:hypothetical protein